MKERPILFSAPMVRALLDGSKTQTRRALRVQPMDVLSMKGEHAGREWVGLMTRDPEPKGTAFRCKFGVPGDRLWVRETFAYLGTNKRGPYAYRADTEDGEQVRVDAPWKPSIHMPRAVSRILLEVVSVRVERLQDISQADAKAEGITPHAVRQIALFGATAEERSAMYRSAAVDPYRELWESINGAGSWAANPWVWVVEFKRGTP